jgi:hypothetical protein
VTLFVLIAVFILLVIVIVFVVGGDHGPGGHAPGMLRGFATLVVCRDVGCPTADITPGSDTTAGDVRPSQGGH